MKWGKLQRECHRLLDEIFYNKGDAYKWLTFNFHLAHFSNLKYPHDLQKLEEIYKKLYLRDVLGKW